MIKAQEVHHVAILVNGWRLLLACTSMEYVHALPEMLGSPVYHPQGLEMKCSQFPT